MGGQPLFALNIVAFPRKELPLEILTEILRGGMDKAHEAGIHILGGHTIDDTEPKYGLVVTGEVHEKDLIRNDSAQEGDALILTKPLGTGIIATAIKQGSASEHSVVKAIESMSSLNRDAAMAAQEVGVHAMTDVTGFGLLGHLLEMCTASGLQAKLDITAIPIIPGTSELAALNTIPGGTRRNLAFVEKVLVCDDQITEADQLIVADAQTSDGLLISLDSRKTDTLVARLNAKGIASAAVIGSMTQTGEPRIELKGR